MWTLISLGTGSAFVYSVVATVAPQVFPDSFVSMGRVAVYFEAAALIISLTLPVTKRVGDKLIGATLHTSGALVMQSEHVGSATVLSQIVQMVALAQRSRPTACCSATRQR
jgi:cation transport ATPase